MSDRRFIYTGNWASTYNERGNTAVCVYEYKETDREWKRIQRVPMEYSVSGLWVDTEKYMLYISLEISRFQQEEPGGRVLWFKIDRETGMLMPAGQINSFGAFPLDLKLSEHYALVLNHGSNRPPVCGVFADRDGTIRTGNVFDAATLVLFERDDEGNLTKARDFYAFTGSGEIPFFQDTASPHSLCRGMGRTEYLVPERGTDRVSIFRIDGENWKISRQGEIRIPKGYGPRNAIAVQGLSSCYVIGEIMPAVLLCKESQGELSPVQKLTTVPEKELEQYKEPVTSFQYPHPSALAVSPDHRFLYTLTRAADVLAVYPLHPETGEMGNPSCHRLSGANPRQLLLEGGDLYIMFQDTETIERVRLNAITGTPVQEITVIRDIPRLAVMDMLVMQQEAGEAENETNYTR